MENEMKLPESTAKKCFKFVLKHPQYLVALILLVVGIFIQLPDSTQSVPIPVSYLKLWSLIVFTLGCFFPFVIASISRRSRSKNTKFSFISILMLISLFSLAFGIGLLFGDLFSFNVINMAFISYGIGGYAGLFLINVLVRD
ncbi:MAG: hypothetical protein PHH63_05300 [Bacteroidales bacterium]|jgi:hypothetical protein|nr:hypothetical protein [Bacteroidales bacterium]MDD3161978.1 hypothetical protein [Bacteroidales bacterium]